MESLSSSSPSIFLPTCPVCKHDKVSVVVSGIVSCPCQGFQFRVVIGWPCPLSLSLSLHILEAGHILGQRLCGWVAVLIHPLGVLPGYRKWPFQDPSPPLLESSATVASIDCLGLLPIPGLWQVIEIIHPVPHDLPSFFPALPIYYL